MINDELFQGEYLVMKNKLVRNRITLLIRDRKKETEKKPGKFLLFKENENSKFQYLSSLYPVGQDSFILDNTNPKVKDSFQEIGKYSLKLLRGVAIIEKVSQ